MCQRNDRGDYTVMASGTQTNEFDAGQPRMLGRIDMMLADLPTSGLDSRQRRKLALQKAKETTNPEHWQTTKSEFTRESILSAIVECLAEFGYSNLTLGQVARKAGLSKGAMQHHFESKAAAIEAALRFIFQQQLEMQKTYGLQPTESHEAAHARRVEARWRFVSDPSYVAFVEIAMASRTDPHLRELVQQYYAEYQRQAQLAATEIMPEWQNDLDKFRLISRLVLTCLEGMAIRQNFGLSDDREDKALRDYLKSLVAQVFEETPVVAAAGRLSLTPPRRRAATRSARAAPADRSRNWCRRRARGRPPRR
jgi:AcrR family transcriptional regulator